MSQNHSILSESSRIAAIVLKFWDRLLRLDLSDKVNWGFGTRCKKVWANPFFQRILFSPQGQLKISITYQMPVFEIVSSKNGDQTRAFRSNSFGIFQTEVPFP
ncbi:hypothetical protein LBK6_10960 [Leptospira borgpetersenii serovar Hardjo]|nr:hypothetical protein LBK6_10960 [Leptospira borgpetersenii serovar Hardjo]AMX62086.1 hypothetical protein LBK9_11000 [Leptospira borgpetersenii serovar Hardjo]